MSKSNAQVYIKKATPYVRKTAMVLCDVSLLITTVIFIFIATSITMLQHLLEEQVAKNDVDSIAELTNENAAKGTAKDATEYVATSGMELDEGDADAIINNLEIISSMGIKHAKDTGADSPKILRGLDEVSADFSVAYIGDSEVSDLAAPEYPEL